MTLTPLHRAMLDWETRQHPLARIAPPLCPTDFGKIPVLPYWRQPRSRDLWGPLEPGFECAVAVDANAAAAAHTTGATSLNLSFTMGSVANGALVAQLFFSVNVGSITATWDSGGTNQSMTVIVNAVSASTHRVALFGLVAPTSGAHTLALTWTTTAEAYANATSFSGVNQTGGTTSFAHSGSATAFGAPTLTITSAVGNMTLAAAVIDASNNVSITQTDVLNVVGTAIQAMATRGTGAATVTHTWDGDSNTWVVVGVDIVAAGASAQPFVGAVAAGARAFGGQSARGGVRG